MQNADYWHSGDAYPTCDYAKISDEVVTLADSLGPYLVPLLKLLVFVHVPSLLRTALQGPGHEVII